MNHLDTREVVDRTFTAARRNQNAFMANISDADLRGIVLRLCYYVLEYQSGEPPGAETETIVLQSLVEVIVKDFGGALEPDIYGQLVHACSRCGFNMVEHARKFK